MDRGTFLFGTINSLGVAALARPARRVLRITAGPLGHDLDPYLDAEHGVDELAWLYADGLVGWNDGLVPVLAERLPEWSVGKSVYHYRLRDVRWHDGRHVRASDIADAISALRRTPWGTREPYVWVSHVRVTGDREFEVHLREPHDDFVRSFFGPYGYPALPLIRHDAGRRPIGTGPFAVRRRPEPERWLLERWTGSPRGTSPLDGIELRLVTLDVTANVQLIAGEADIALPLPPRPLGMGNFRRVRRVTSTAVLMINTAGVLDTVAARHAFAAVANVPVLQRAFDRERTSLLASLLLTSESDSAFARLLEFHPERGAALRALMGDRELTLVYVAGSPAHERTMTMLQQQLKAVGLRSVLRPYPAFMYTGSAGPLRSGKFDVAVYGLLYRNNPDLAADWLCRNRPPNGGNFARWCDPVFEGAIGSGAQSRAIERIYSEVGCIPLSRAYENIGVGPAVVGFAQPLPLVPATYGCVRWDLSAQRASL
ncbi:MAG: extracellular solute-binding protein family 5 [Candidatus Eremiobacteraeota bacterium]|nr:extracellular solute-binding protein family 5 [Candidatus Eremiobacteraeota bacterium]